MATRTPPAMAGTPLAFFITFTTYGSWLPGDERGWIDRSRISTGDAVRAGDPARHARNASSCSSRRVTLSGQMRAVVEQAIRATCVAAEWEVIALWVGQNHVHALVASGCSATRTLSRLKGQATFALRQASLLAPNSALWSRQGSTRYLWKQQSVTQVQYYIEQMQGCEKGVMPWYGHGE